MTVTTRYTIDQALADAISDTEGDMPGATDDPGVYHDLCLAVAAYGWPARVIVDFYRRQGIDWLLSSSSAPVWIDTPPTPAPTYAERQAARLAARDAALTDPANADALARIRARRAVTRSATAY